GVSNHRAAAGKSAGARWTGSRRGGHRLGHVRQRDTRRCLRHRGRWHAANQGRRVPMSYQPPGDMRMTWLIGQRAAIEAMQDQLSLLMGVGFAFVLPILLVALIVRPVGSSPSADGQPPLGDMLAIYLLVVGLLPTIAAIGIACGQFAGEKERGILTPLLASPASNMAIFAGKVVGAIIPSLVYAMAADC